jgi:protein-tyrosine phosphatase
MTEALKQLALAEAGRDMASDAWEAVRRTRRPIGSPFMTKDEAEALKDFERAVARRCKASAEVQRLEAEACKAAR